MFTGTLLVVAWVGIAGMGAAAGLVFCLMVGRPW